jgi:hypothetical protein
LGASIRTTATRSHALLFHLMVADQPFSVMVRASTSTISELLPNAAAAACQ